MFIYTIQNQINNKIYIGQSINVRDRINEHKRKIRNKIHENTLINKDAQIFGLSTFTFNIIYTASTQNELNTKECEYIMKFNAFYRLGGYNIAKGGIGVLGQITKQVYQFDLNGRFLNKFNSTREASRIINIDCAGIVRSCNKILKSYKKFIWSYNENVDDRISTITSNKHKKTKVYQYSVAGEFIEIYNSIKEACSIVGLDSGNISRAINKKNHYYGGYYWYTSRQKNKLIHKFLVIKKILIFDKNNKFILEVDNQHEAAKFINGYSANINHCLKNRKKSYKGYIFKYKSDTKK